MKKRKKLIGFLLTGVLVCSNVSMVMAAPKNSATPKASSTAKPKKTEKTLDTKVDVNGKYHATLGFETESSYRSVYRYGYFDDKNRAKEEWKQIVSGTKGEYNYRTYKGTFKNAVIKGNGTYSVQLRNADYRNASTFKLLQVCTDIPNTGDIKFSDLKVIVNGQTKLKFKEVSTSSSQDYVVLYAINDKKEALADLGDDKRIVPPSYQNNSVIIKFKVSGFQYKKGEVPPTPTPEPTATPEPTQEASESPGVSEETNEETSTKTEEKQTNVITQEKKLGIGLVVVVAIGGILASVVIVNKRKR